MFSDCDVFFLFVFLEAESSEILIKQMFIRSLVYI